MYPQVPYYNPPAPPPLSQAQRDALIVQEIRRLRSDLTSAFNPYSLQKILDSTLQVLEYMLAGAVIHPNPNQVPGRAVDPLDAGKTKVEFFGGPQTPAAMSPPVSAFPVIQPIVQPVAPLSPGYAPPPFGLSSPPAFPPPSTPVQNGDVQFVQTGPTPQGVELYGGPAGAQSYERNGQRVEFFPNPPGTPVTGNPSTPPISTQNNPPSSQILSGSPPVTVEAGHQVPPAHASLPSPKLPSAPPFANAIPMETSGAIPNSQIRAPQSREELISMLPVPTTPNGA